MTEDEMVGWHHRLDGHEFEQALGFDDGLESLACCSPRGRKELDMTELNNINQLQNIYKIVRKTFMILMQIRVWKTLI